MRSSILILAMAILSTGCATITRGTNEAFGIETTPVGAEARLSNGLHCTTPCSVSSAASSAPVSTPERAPCTLTSRTPWW